MRILCCLILIFVASCTTRPPAKNAFVCDAYIGTDDLLAKARTHVLALAESIHGTNETPHAITGIACEALKRGLPVKIGIETEAWQTLPLKDALAHPFDRKKMLAAAPSLWTVEDGRSSVAVLRLLEQISIWRAMGHDVSVFAFDFSYKDDYEKTRDSSAKGKSVEWVREGVMAKHVDAAAKEFDGAIILFTGAYHARKKPFDFNGGLYESMPTRVNVRPIFSLRMRHSGGQGWMIGGTENDNGTFAEIIGPFAPPPNVVADDPVRTFQFEPTKSGSFDGSYFTGPLTVSPPAQREVRSEK